MKPFRPLMMLLVAAIGFPLPHAGRAADSSDEFVRQRRELAHRQRRVILNNDGCDALYFPSDREPTAENFLALRTSPLADSHVDAVF